ncbi:uncharacterized protein TRAVEDRAFT_28303 [Trametes versicolor FP-101664 SS1]|uniref:uncharacterized protein n=1 Tax=Trametes versicolor (strain FP-101664) TaxID=717944 RepID=UPI00046218CC|nr:uncharacterized protein TRAVEDRAFT_28303 [Trametes versicolor FP-101664 SS1]EIW60852.1 hypothetical protein TRAVEDRAFT_28303 [Trametes versicolor FP-101664 SS1]
MPVNINRLDVGLSPIEDPYAVAAFLSDWMSDMDSLRSGWIDLMDGDGDDTDDEDGEDEDTTNGDLGWSSIARIYHKRWRMVERLIPMFARVRMQERHWKWKTAGPPMCVPRENEIPMDFYDELDVFWTGIHW